MRKAILGGLGIVFVLGIVFHACKKEKIIIQGSRTDTIYVQYENCQYDTSLPINCYTTHLRGSARRLRSVKEDTIVWYFSRCVTFGFCEFEKFYPYYKVCFRSPPGGRIPDTTMCRDAGIPLCCPSFGEEIADDMPRTDVDISRVLFTITNICTKQSKWVSFHEIGQTKYLEHPDSNPNFSCQTHLQTLFPDSIQRHTFKNCSIRLIEIPKQFDYDTITVVYLPQGPNGNYIPCCAGTVNLLKPPTYDLFDMYVKIGLQCN